MRPAELLYCEHENPDGPCSEECVLCYVEGLEEEVENLEYQLDCVRQAVNP